MEQNKGKKILILSASIGTGHTQAAKAMEEYWKLHNPENEVVTVDFLSTETFSIDNLVRETYIKMIDVFPMLYDMVYRLSQGGHKGGLMQTFVSWFLKQRMLRLVDKIKPDVLVFTHPFPCGAACLLRRQKLLDIPMIGVITDFTVHQFWIYQQVDNYCVSTPKMVEELVQGGIDAKKIHITGIPIRREFFGKPPRHLEPLEEVVALVMSGGLGLSSIQRALQYLDDVPSIDRFIVVAGHNGTLHDTLLEMKHSLKTPMEVYGYTNLIPSLMEKATLIVTKPGALTCTEAVTSGLPIVCFDAIPGHEEANAIFLEGAGAARWARDIHNLADVVTALVSNPSRLRDMSEAGQKLILDGAKNIDDVLHQLLLEREEQPLLMQVPLSQKK